MVKCANIRLGLSVLLFTIISVFAETAVERHGWLKTDAGYLLNEKNQIVQLRGFSFFWSNPDWVGQYQKYYNAATVNTLVDKWKCTVLRVAYDRDKGRDNGWSGCQTVIDQAIKRGIYVIIDWHSHEAHNQQSAAVKFFTEQAKKYKDVPNVLFEPYNEPITTDGSTIGDAAVATKTWKGIKPYLSAVTKAIRDQGSKNIVIVGTPFYCQHIQVAASDPITYTNVAYAFHFYAASHGPNSIYAKRGEVAGLENTYLNGALGKVPIFITEWGTTHADGGEGGKHNEVDAENTDWWFEKYVNGKYHMSWCNWSVSDFQASSAFSGNASSPSNSGKIVQKYLLNQSTDTYEPDNVKGTEGPAKDSVFSMPGYHAAFAYNQYYGANMKKASVPYSSWDKNDSRAKILKNSNLAVGAGVSTEWAAYKINAKSSTKFIHIRHLSKGATGTIEIQLDGKNAGTVNIPEATVWSTLIKPLEITGGAHTITFKFTNATGSGYGISWFELSNSQTTNALFDKINSSNISTTSATVKKGDLHILLPTAHNYSSYTLLSADGRMILNADLTNSTNSFSLQNLSSGIWFVKLNSNSNTKLLKAIISGQ